ncbi:MAG TPA: hypothetical protein ENO21_01645, partial [Firmicutes bacterium]|nr:hypothetical protein [Bacillota bacterium]
MINASSLKGYRYVFLAYGFATLLFFHPFLSGDVAAPHRQILEVGAVATNLTTSHLENRKFSDYTSEYIPEISEHLRGSRSGWLTLWTDHNELGRPVYHISGFSPAYPPSWIIGKLTDSPWRFTTVLSLLACFGAGIFVMLYCREIGLAPLAGLIAGSSLAASPLFMYWLIFPMFPAVWCWSVAALWAMTRLARRPDLIGWGTLAFSGYSLLMTVYPQPVVYHAYLLGGYGLYLAYRKRRHNPAEIVRFVALGASALVVVGVLALPVYLDLALIAAESERVAPDPSFFTAILPAVDSVASGLRFMLLSTVPELFGNPIKESFPFKYDGLSITPLVMFLGVVGLFTAFRRTWGWWLAIVVFFLLTFVHPLYVLGVEYLGLGLSRSIPLGSITLPLTVIVAHGADALIRREDPETVSRAAKYAASSVFAVIATGTGLGVAGFVPVRWGMVLAMLVVAGLLAANCKTTRPALLLAALLTVLISISYPLMLRQDPAHIATTSPLVEKICANLSTGSRFAVAAPEISILPPNLNASLGLASVHSYNSLSSRRYHT